MESVFTYFAPNWVLFLFSLFEMIGRCNLYQIKANNLGIQILHILRPIGRFFYFLYLIWQKGVTYIKLKACILWIQFLHILRPIGCFFIFLCLKWQEGLTYIKLKLITWGFSFTHFAPNWALCLFSLLEMTGEPNLYQIKAYNLGFSFLQILRSMSMCIHLLYTIRKANVQL